MNRTLLLLLPLLGACSLEKCLLGTSIPYSESVVPPAPDYSTDAAWAALPERVDKADLTAPSQLDNQASAPADLFFLHPTTHFSSDQWLEPVGPGTASTELLEEVVIPKGAALFNGCCRIYAPRYRQMTIGGYFGDLEDTQAAFSVGYGDIERAFNAFLERTGDRPFILASQSQGSLQAMRLLERIDADPALRERFVAAYIPGAVHPESRFGTAYKHLQPCDAPEQLGCVASWDTYRDGASTRGTETLVHWQEGKIVKHSPETPQCTNPVSWRDDGAATKAQHLGAVNLVNGGHVPSFLEVIRATEPLGFNTTGLQDPVPNLVDTHCKGGFLFASDLSTTSYPASETGPGDYHLMDFELFAADIRANTVLRVATWLAAHPAPKPTDAPTPTTTAP